MRRPFVSVLLCAGLCSMSKGAPADATAGADGPATAPDVQWTLRVLYLPGGQDVRLPLNAQEGVIPVRARWQCNYKRTTLVQQDIVKIKCIHESGAVVGTLAMCRREVGQLDLAQLSIGMDGVAAYETIDLSCSIPRDREHADGAYEQRK
jgi:hypothetical protein